MLMLHLSDIDNAGKTIVPMTAVFLSLVSDVFNLLFRSLELPFDTHLSFRNSNASYIPRDMLLREILGPGPLIILSNRDRCLMLFCLLWYWYGLTCPYLLVLRGQR